MSCPPTDAYLLPVMQTPSIIESATSSVKTSNRPESEKAEKVAEPQEMGTVTVTLHSSSSKPQAGGKDEKVPVTTKSEGEEVRTCTCGHEFKKVSPPTLPLSASLGPLPASPVTSASKDKKLNKPLPLKETKQTHGSITKYHTDTAQVLKRYDIEFRKHAMTSNRLGQKTLMRCVERTVKTIVFVSGGVVGMLVFLIVLLIVKGQS
jgi:hypothetical protein